MNYETIIRMALSYGLGYFTFWIKGRCSADKKKKDAPFVCHYQPKES